MPHSSAAGAGGGIDGDDDLREIGRAAYAVVLDPRSAPQRCVVVLDQLGVEFLAAEARAGIAALHRLEEAGRQILRIGACGAARHRDVGRRQQAAQRRDVARRGGERQARIGADAQAHQRHVERGLRVGPFGEFVAPDRIELVAADAVGLVGAEHGGDGAAGPHDAAVGGLERRAVGGGEQAGDAFDHDRTRIAICGADEADVVHGAVGHAFRDPLGAAAGLSGAAAAEEQPDAPAAVGRELFGARLPLPVAGRGRGALRHRDSPPSPRADPGLSCARSLRCISRRTSLGLRADLVARSEARCASRPIRRSSDFCKRSSVRESRSRSPGASVALRVGRRAARSRRARSAGSVLQRVVSPCRLSILAECPLR